MAVVYEQHIVGSDGLDERSRQVLSRDAKDLITEFIYFGARLRVNGYNLRLEIEGIDRFARKLRRVSRTDLDVTARPPMHQQCAQRDRIEDREPAIEPERCPSIAGGF